jgi:hypothetical protein
MHKLDRIPSLDDASLVLFPCLTQLLRLDYMLSLNYYKFDMVLDYNSLGLDYILSPSVYGSGKTLDPNLSGSTTPHAQIHMGLKKH